MKRLTMLVMCALMAMSAQADTLSDVRNAVMRMSAKQPVRATFATEAIVKSAGKFANDNTTRAASAVVTHDASGISITIPQTLLDQVSATKAKDRSNDKAQHLIGSLRPIVIVEALDFRDSFLELVHDAKVTAESRVIFGGRSVRLLTLKLSPSTDRQPNSIRIGSVKAEGSLKLWVGDDNIPLAAERADKTTAGLMMFKASFAGRSKYTFGRTADRFYVARLETEDNGSGLGQNVARSGVQTLTIH